MKKQSKLLLILIFALLSMIHFYWGFGGEWGLQNSLPVNEKGIKVLNPKSIDSFMVGFFLAFISFFYLKLFNNQQFFIKFLRFFIPSIFLLRAIGDFKFVGFFKTITKTNFANADTTFYTPLCLLISFTGFYLVLKK